jgi:prolyl oligopeptidase PreP (S9A serine peptidase family)
MIDFPKHDAEQFFETYMIDKFTVSKDEKRLVFSLNLNGKPNLWAMDLPNTYPYPLTYCNQKSDFIALDSNGKFILTSFDEDGDENYQIHALRPGGGKPFNLISTNKEEKHEFGHLSEDGERLYYTTSRDNEMYLNVRRYNIRTKEDELLHTGAETRTYVMAVSPDEQTIILQKMFSNTYVLSYALHGDKMICLTPNSEVEHTTSLWQFVNNDTVLFATDYEADFMYLASFNLQTKEFKVVYVFENEDVHSIQFHKETNSCYVVTNKGVEDYLYRLSLEDYSVTPLEIPVGVVWQVHVADSGNVYILGATSTTPTNIYIRKPDTNEWDMLTNNRIVGLGKESLAEPEVVMYESYDGLKIEALLYRAKEDVATGYTIFMPHGGPQWANRKDFDAMCQYIVSLGHTVFMPNFRGSTCYGTTFMKMVEGDWGEGPRLDCVTGIEWLIEQGITERGKLFCVGGSYGGYMTLLLTGRHPEYFRAAVDIVGPSNLFSFIESVPEDWKPIMERWIGHPERDKEKLTADSPITYLDNMVVPLFIIQGANDPRVVKAESDQMYEALKSKDRDVEYMVVEDEGHGFAKKENQIAVFRRMAAFLERYQMEEVL